MFIFCAFKNSKERFDRWIDQLSRIIPILLLAYPHKFNLLIMSLTNSLKSLLFHVPFFNALNDDPLLVIAEIIETEFAKLMFLIGFFSPFVDHEYKILVFLLNNDSSILTIQSRWFMHFANLKQNNIFLWIFSLKSKVAHLDEILFQLILHSLFQKVSNYVKWNKNIQNILISIWTSLDV